LISEGSRDTEDLE